MNKENEMAQDSKERPVDTASPDYQAGYTQGLQDGERRGRARTLRNLRNRLQPLLGEDVADDLTDPEALGQPTLPPDTSIRSIGLPTRISNTLSRWGKHTIASVLPMTDDDLLDIFGMGPQFISDLDAVLAGIGYRRGQQLSHPQFPQD